MRKEFMRRRFGAEVALAGLTAVFALLTLVWSDWIEIVFRVDPDQSSGSLESLVVGALVACTVAFSALARLELRRAATRAA